MSLSGRGTSSSSSSKFPAHASRFVKNVDRLNRFVSVAEIDVRSNCDVFVGPFGSWKTVPFATHGDISVAASRRPRRRKSNFAFGHLQGASSATTPSYGGTT